MSFCIVIVWRGIHTKGSWKYRQLKHCQQTWTAVPETSAHHAIRKVLQKKHSGVTIKNAMKGRIYFLRCRQGRELTFYVKIGRFLFAKIDSHNNESDTNVKTSQLGNGGESVRTLFTFSVPNDLPPTSISSVLQLRGRSGFKSRSGYRLSCLTLSWFFSVPPDKCSDSPYKFGHDRYLSTPFQFILHFSPVHRLYTV